MESDSEIEFEEVGREREESSVELSCLDGANFGEERLWFFEKVVDLLDMPDIDVSDGDQVSKKGDDSRREHFDLENRQTHKLEVLESIEEGDEGVLVSPPAVAEKRKLGPGVVLGHDERVPA